LYQGLSNAERRYFGVEVPSIISGLSRDEHVGGWAGGRRSGYVN